MHRSRGDEGSRTLGTSNLASLATHRRALLHDLKAGAVDTHGPPLGSARSETREGNASRHRGDGQQHPGAAEPLELVKEVDICSRIRKKAGEVSLV